MVVNWQDILTADGREPPGPGQALGGIRSGGLSAVVTVSALGTRFLRPLPEKPL